MRAESTLDGDAGDVVKDDDAAEVVINPEDVVVWGGSTELLDGAAGDTVNGSPPWTRNGCAGWVGKMSGVTS